VTRIVILGAGDTGELMLRSMNRSRRAYRVVGFLDDDPTKAHRWIAGVPVRGTLDDLERVLRRYSVDEVVLSSPAINGSVEARVREVCVEQERKVRRFSMEIQ
jgi:FlaA1/EpsC-like NDP-sugar epimerase